MVSVALSRRAKDRPLKLFRLLGLVLLAGTLLLLAVPLGRRGPSPQPLLVNGRAALTVVGEGSLRAGAAQVALPSRAPMAGYPARGTGSGGPLYARALVLEAGPVRQIIVSLETLLVPGPLEEALVRRAQLAPSACLLLTATHTHSGVGGTWRNALAEFGGNGRYDAQIEWAVVEAAARAIHAAIAALGPARLSWNQMDWPAGPAEPRSAGPIDTTLTALRIERPSGAPVATVIDYAMHPTMEPRKSARLSGDWPGALSAALEVSGNVALVLQGASGNATWSRGAGTEQAIAARIATAAQALVERTQPGSTASALQKDAAGGARVQLGCEVRLLSLPPAQAAPGVPFLLRRGAGNLIALFAESSALRTTLLIDGLTLLGVPGEPVGALAQAARAGAGGKVAIVGLSDGYIGYIEPPGGTGEAARTYHGPGLAESLGLWKQAAQ